MLSKLDYEEKKDLYKELAKDSKNGLTNKKKKNKVMSLEQFLGNPQSAIESKSKLKLKNIFGRNSITLLFVYLLL